MASIDFHIAELRFACWLIILYAKTILRMSFCQWFTICKQTIFSEILAMWSYLFWNMGYQQFDKLICFLSIYRIAYEEELASFSNLSTK